MRELIPAAIAAILAFNLGLATSSAHASCNGDEVLDLRVIYPDIFNHLGISNQGNIGVCYAHAATALIEFHRLRLNSDQAWTLSTNPDDAAQIGTLHAQTGGIEGGHICDVVSGMVKRGFGYSYMNLTSAQTLDLGYDAQREAVNRIFIDYLGGGSARFKPVDKKYYPPAKRGSLNADQKAYLKKFDGLIAVIKADIASRKIDLKTIPSDAEIFDFIQNNHIRNDYANFPVKFEMFIGGGASTRASFRMPNLTCAAQSGLYDGSSYFDNLDRTLSYQHLPVGIDFCANILTQKKYNGYDPDHKMRKDCKVHAAVVIGRRLGRQGCEYLIRNSWGAEYSGYAWPTDQGDIWVPEFALTPTVFGTSIVR